MSKIKPCNILLKNLPLGESFYEFELDDHFFQQFDNSAVQRGDVKADISVVRRSNHFEFVFSLEGYVSIACDRCLDDMEQEISCEEKLLVKFGNHFSDETDIIIVSEAEGVFDAAWLLYEFTILSIPVKHVHEPGDCDEELISKLRQHIAFSVTDEDEDDDDDENALLDLYDEEDLDDEEEIDEEKTIDARWEALRKISDNN